MKCLYQMQIHHRSFELEAGIQVPLFPCISEWPITRHWSSPIYTKKLEYLDTDWNTTLQKQLCGTHHKRFGGLWHPITSTAMQPGHFHLQVYPQCVFPAGNPKDHLPHSQHGNLTLHTGVRAARISWHFYISHCSKRYGQDLQTFQGTFKRGIICI